MTNPTWLEEIVLSNREGIPTIVRKGQKVDLADIGSVADEEERFFAKKNKNFLLRYLGKGPYSVSEIGMWPCGKVMIYLKTETSPSSGVYASDLVCVE